MSLARVHLGMLLVLVVIVAMSLPLAAAEKCEKGEDVKVTVNDLPPAVAATLQQAVGSGAIQEIEKEADGSYSADVIKDGQKYEIEIAPDGKLLKNQIDEENESRHEGNDKDEVAVTLNDVPAAVAATIQNAAAGGTIDEISKETKGDKTFYEAKITVNGKKSEVKVSEDGSLVKSKACKSKCKKVKNEEDEKD